MKFRARKVKTRAGTLLLRKARMADAKELNRIFCTPDVNRFLMFPPSGLKRTQDSIRKDSKGRRLGIVAVRGGKVIGRISLRPNEGRSSHTADFGIMVDYKFHGKGVGSALLAALFSAAKEIGIRKIESSYNENNKNGARLYGKMGFRKEGKRMKMVKRGGKYEDCFLIGKWLG